MRNSQLKFFLSQSVTTQGFAKELSYFKVAVRRLKYFVFAAFVSLCIHQNALATDVLVPSGKSSIEGATTHDSAFFSHKEQTEQRIISADAGTTEIIVALGKGRSLVGIDVTSSVPETLKVEKVGYHRNLSAEGLLSLSPSIVFGSEHIGPKEAVAALKRANTELVLQPTAKDIDQLMANVKQVASALNVSSNALVDQLALAKTALQSASKSRQSEGNNKAVFLLYLESRGLKQAGKGTSGDALIDLLALTNLSDYSGYRSISAEGLLAMQPEVIFVASQSPQAVTSLLSKFPALNHTPAASANKVLFVDAASLVSGMSLKAVDEAARLSQAL